MIKEGTVVKIGDTEIIGIVEGYKMGYNIIRECDEVLKQHLRRNYYLFNDGALTPRIVA